MIRKPGRNTKKYAKMADSYPCGYPEGSGIQDSNGPISTRIEKLYPEPSINPDETGHAVFISALIDEFGYEWATMMFHYLWARYVDQRSSAGRIAPYRWPKP